MNQFPLSLSWIFPEAAAEHEVTLINSISIFNNHIVTALDTK